MIPPPAPPDEEQRLASLRSLCILDTAPEEGFDRVTRLGANSPAYPLPGPSRRELLAAIAA